MFTKRIRQEVEYFLVWLLVKILENLPRKQARKIACKISVGLTKFFTLFFRRKKIFHTADQTIAWAFPELTKKQRTEIFYQSIQHTAWQIVELVHASKFNRQNIDEVILIEGFENYTQALARGKGVIIMSAHFSAYEIAPALLSHYGINTCYVVRPINNPKIHTLLNRKRAFPGCLPLNKNQSAKILLETLRAGKTVAITIDQNTTIHEGVFVNFFNKQACTSTGIARLALRTDASVVPGFVFWDPKLNKYKLRFEPEIEIVRTGSRVYDIKENTSRFSQIVEHYVRLYPDQWTRWSHNRWKTRPLNEQQEV
jgi:Kdo2-lipid IVA lauroyltransferase/acyltransferase